MAVTFMMDISVSSSAEEVKNVLLKVGLSGEICDILKASYTGEIRSSVFGLCCLIKELVTFYKLAEELIILQKLQNNLSWKSTKKTLKPALTVVDAMDESTTSSACKEPSRLVLAVHEDGSLHAVNAAGGLQIDYYLLNLFAAYYARNLTYTRAYQPLKFVQVHVLKDDSEKVFKASAFTKLE